MVPPEDGTWDVRNDSDEFFNLYADDVDVMAHEYTHLLIDHETNGTGSGEGGWEFEAIHEGMGDIFGSAVDHTWEMGEGGGRDPEAGTEVATTYDEAREGPPRLADMSKAMEVIGRSIPSSTGEGPSTGESDLTGGIGGGGPEAHHASGVLSNAAADIQQQLGWDEMENVFYAVLTDDGFTTDSRFVDVATMARSHAIDQYGEDAGLVVEKAFADNGVYIPGTPTARAHENFEQVRRTARDLLPF